MRVDSRPPLLTLPVSGGGALPSLRLGDELLAKVLRADPSRVLLQIGDSTVEARSTLTLQPGRQLLLRVTQLQPALVLQLTAQARGDQAVDAALRALLPQPAARAPLTGALAPLLALPSERLPEPARQALAALLARLPVADTLTRPAGLARAVAASGLFLESRLARTGAPPAGDLKAALLQLLQAMRAGAATKDPGAAAEADPLKITEATEGALARLQLLQLHAATSPRLDLLVELPTLFGGALELLELRIEADKDRARADEPDARDAPAPAHQVRLGFSFAESGRLDALVRLRGERVTVGWWAERPQAAAILREQLPLLARRLAELGLEVEEIGCLDGRPPAPSRLPILRREGLLNERA